MILPLIAFAAVLVGSLFLSGCERPKPKEPKTTPENDEPPKCSGPEPELKFTEAERPLAYSFYQELKNQDICLKDLDKGFRVINYSAVHCPSFMTRYCVKGKDDGFISADEVLEYTFDHSDTYREMIERTLDRPLPWVLDDLDSATEFDQEIRDKVFRATGKLYSILAKQGIREDSKDYDEKLSVGLYYLTMVPDSAEISERIKKDPKAFEKFTDELKKLGLEEYWEFLKKEGGMYIKGDYSQELSALEALEKKRGKCTELSKILFAVFLMAGLKPTFVMIKRENLRFDDPSKQKIIDTIPKGMDHMCVGLYLNGKFRLFDPATAESNAKHEDPVALSLRQYLSFDYSNSGLVSIMQDNSDRGLADLNMAIAIDPNNANAYFDRASLWARSGEFDKAQADMNQGIEIIPDNEIAYNNRGIYWAQKGELALAMQDWKRSIEINPKFADAYFNQGLTWASRDECDTAIKDLSMAIKIDPRNANAIYIRGSMFVRKGELKSAILDFAETVRLDPDIGQACCKQEVPTEGDTLTETIKRYLGVTQPNRVSAEWVVEKSTHRWHSSSVLESAATAFQAETGGENIARAEVKFIFSCSLWAGGYRQGAIKILRQFSELRFTHKPSQFTKDFFTNMFDLMPQEMLKDKEVQGVVQGIKDKLK